MSHTEALILEITGTLLSFTLQNTLKVLKVDIKLKIYRREVYSPYIFWYCYGLNVCVPPPLIHMWYSEPPAGVVSEGGNRVVSVEPS